MTLGGEGILISNFAIGEKHFLTERNIEDPLSENQIDCLEQTPAKKLMNQNYCSPSKTNNLSQNGLISSVQRKHLKQA